MKNRSLLLAVSTVALALTSASCGSGGEPSAETAPPTTAATAPATTEAIQDDPEIAGVLSLFVEAAGRGDAEAMWGLLSEQSRRELGPTLDDFAREYADGFQEGLGRFAGIEYDVLLSDVVPSGWGIAAIAGDRPRGSQTEFATYAVMLAKESTGWRLELGDDVSVNLLSPGPSTEEKQPTIRFLVKAGAPVEEAGLWVDGEPVPGIVSGSGSSVQVSGRPGKPLPPGPHVIVVFGRSGGQATAGASPFVVEGGPSA